MSKKYINADALIMGLRNRAKEEWSQKTTTRWETAYDEVADEIDELAAADVRENVRGEWVDRNGNIVFPFWERYECSECGARSDNKNFCPNCGADMRGDVDGGRT